MPSGALIAFGAAFVIAALLLMAMRRRPPSGRPGVFDRDQQEQVREQMARLLADIQDLSREQIARLDTKIRMLQQLLADADARIRELRSLMERSGPGGPPPPPRPSNPLHDRVYALADGGKSIMDIGVETGLERGEIELILGLRKVGQPSGLSAEAPAKAEARKELRIDSSTKEGSGP